MLRPIQRESNILKESLKLVSNAVEAEAAKIDKFSQSFVKILVTAPTN